MYRSIFFNCWIGLLSFTIYFIKTIYSTKGLAAPIPTIAYSVLWGTIGFVAAYGLRAMLDYVLYTPEIPEIDTPDLGDNGNGTEDKVQVDQPFVKTSTVEFQDESSEDIAQVVRTMLNQDEPSIRS